MSLFFSILYFLKYITFPLILISTIFLEKQNFVEANCGCCCWYIIFKFFDKNYFKVSLVVVVVLVLDLVSVAILLC